MGAPVLVLVHGANHSSTCWDPTVDALATVAPDRQVLAIDLPGRGRSPIDPTALTLRSCIDRVVESIDDADIEQVVLVGHSFGGALLPGVAMALGAERVRHLVFIAATIPPDGNAVVDTMGRSVQLTVKLAARRRKLSNYPRRLAAAKFCNGMTDQQREFVLANLVPDASWLVTEPVHHADLPPQIPRTWVLTQQDRAVPPDQQRRNIEHLGGVGAIVELDTCHDAMVSAPDELAAILAAQVAVGPT